MSLQADFSASGLRAEGYVRTIWTETELTEDVLMEVDPSYLAAEDLEQAVLGWIKEGSATQCRKDFYKLLVLDYFNQENGITLSEFCNVVEGLDDSENVKREMLANLFTRVLRGELAASELHRLPSDATQILSQRALNPWQARLEKFIALEQGLKH